MGKKDFIMDNGKKAQSSMTLYWNKNKQRSKHPKQKKQLDQKQEQEISDKRVINNFQKWKLHKEKIITKAYTKPQQKINQTQKNTKAKQQQEEQYRIYELMQQKKKPKPMIIPGFKSKSALSTKIQIETPKQADQSTNVLKLPDHMSDLTQDDILQILREKKQKQQIMKRHNINQRKQNGKMERNQSDDEKEDVLLGQDFINLMKKKEKDQIKQKEKEKQQAQRIMLEEKQNQASMTFFKSDILNKIEKEGLHKVLQKVTHKISLQGKDLLENNIQEQICSQIKNIHGEKTENVTLSQPINVDNLKLKFIPRILKK